MLKTKGSNFDHLADWSETCIHRMLITRPITGLAVWAVSMNSYISKLYVRRCTKASVYVHGYTDLKHSLQCTDLMQKYKSGLMSVNLLLLCIKQTQDGPKRDLRKRSSWPLLLPFVYKFYDKTGWVHLLVSNSSKGHFLSHAVYDAQAFFCLFLFYRVQHDYDDMRFFSIVHWLLSAVKATKLME